VREPRGGDDTDDDLDSGVKRPRRDREASLTPMVSSSDPPPNPDPALAARGLPDYSALLAAELAAAAEETMGSTPSSLGVGELILSARELTGLSQRALASRAVTSQGAVTAIETGNRLPTIRSLVRLVEAAGLELVVGLRRPGARDSIVLGALVSNQADGLADYVPITALSPFDGPPDR
jgi:transcriptional regulator with XRE-family HTH domain